MAGIFLAALVGQLVVLGQLHAQGGPLFLMADAAARILIQRDIEALDQLRILVFDKIRRVFGVVFAGFGYIIAKALHDFIAHHIVMLLGARGCAALDLGIQIVALRIADLQQPSLMVDAGDLPLIGIVIGHIQPLEQVAGAHLHAVAQTHRLDGGVALHIAGQHSHGVGVVEEPGVGAHLGHVIGKVLHHGNGAQGAEDAADAQGVGDGLTQAVLLGHIKVRHSAGLVQAHLNGVDYIVGAAQGLLAVFHAQIGLDGGLVAQVLVDGVQHALAVVHAVCVDIVEGDFAVFHNRGRHAVAQHVLGKHAGAGAHECNLRHIFPP